MTVPFILADLIIIAMMIYTLFKIFKGKEIFTTEVKPQTLEFVIEKSGFYALWIHAKLLKLNPARAYPATILNQDKQPLLRLPITGYVAKNSFAEGRQIYRIWYLKAGRYYLHIEHKAPKFFKPSEQPNARYQLKETMPLLVPMGVILLVVLANIIIQQLS